MICMPKVTHWSIVQGFKHTFFHRIAAHFQRVLTDQVAHFAPNVCILLIMVKEAHFGGAGNCQ
jgi:hypothetical protein